MSMKKLAILSAVHNDGRLNGTEMNPTPGSPHAPVYGVNVMLGGAMLSGIILVVFILCYCCHKTNRKSQSHLPTYWRDPEMSMEIYTLDAAQNWLVAEGYHTTEMHRPDTPGPPPAYDLVVPLTKNSNPDEEEAAAAAAAWGGVGNAEFNKSDDTGLPSYETAVKLQGHGYV